MHGEDVAPKIRGLLIIFNFAIVIPEKPKKRTISESNLNLRHTLSNNCFQLLLAEG